MNSSEIDTTYKKLIELQQTLLSDLKNLQSNEFSINESKLIQQKIVTITTLCCNLIKLQALLNKK
jgi:hypothetical protein